MPRMEAGQPEPPGVPLAAGKIEFSKNGKREIQQRKKGGGGGGVKEEEDKRVSETQQVWTKSGS